MTMNNDDSGQGLDLPGANWDRGPRLERTNGRWHQPLIMQDADSIRGKIGLRAGYLAGHLELSHNHVLADALATQLRKLSVRCGMGNAYVERRDVVNEDVLKAHGASIEEGFLGLWAFARNLEAVEESMGAENDE